MVLSSCACAEKLGHPRISATIGSSLGDRSAANMKEEAETATTSLINTDSEKYSVLLGNKCPKRAW